jgi:hypothetical protein
MRPAPGMFPACARSGAPSNPQLPCAALVLVHTQLAQCVFLGYRVLLWCVLAGISRNCLHAAGSAQDMFGGFVCVSPCFAGHMYPMASRRLLVVSLYEVAWGMHDAWFHCAWHSSFFSCYLKPDFLGCRGDTGYALVLQGWVGGRALHFTASKWAGHA